VICTWDSPPVDSYNPGVYGIALSAAACLRAGTRADVAWLVEIDGIEVADWSDAVMFTPGGGRVGALAGGVFDAQLGDKAGRWDTGRLVDVELSNVDALIAGMQAGARGRCVIVPADALPSEVWDLAAARRPFSLVAALDGDEVTSFELSFDETANGPAVTGERIISVFSAAPELALVGSSPVVDALADLAGFLGWKTRVVNDVASAAGVIAGLSSADKVVVAAHDLELAGPALLAALESEAGYIGSVGSRRMQENRADWLAYRGVSDLSRVHGPAGLDIGAETPGEIAVSVLAEAISLNAVAGKLESR
jgi:xanthine dehydrogenase accessory factor